MPGLFGISDWFVPVPTWTVLPFTWAQHEGKPAYAISQYDFPSRIATSAQARYAIKLMILGGFFELLSSAEPAGHRLIALSEPLGDCHISRNAFSFSTSTS